MPAKTSDQVASAAPGRRDVGDALKHLHACEYEKTPATAASLAGVLGLSLDAAGCLADELSSRGLAAASGATIVLTDAGREQARQIVRAHRLYETYLAHETGIAREEWHRRADLAEHELTASAVDELAERLGRPRYDPHGDPIPTRGGSLPPPRGIPLTDAAENADLMVVHVEDEPETFHRQAVALGIHAGTRLRVITKGPVLFRIGVEDRTADLAPGVAGAIKVEPCDPVPAMRALSSLRRGETAKLLTLSPSIVGAERRRMLDLGLVPGTEVEREFDSMLGSPTAYRVRGAVIALRKEQSDRIFVEA